MAINLGTYLSKRAMLSPDKEAIVCEDVRYTWSEPNGPNQLANAMKKLGIKHGDRVGILALNEPEYLTMFYGLGKIGAILVPINYRIAGPEMQYILQDSGPGSLSSVRSTWRSSIPSAATFRQRHLSPWVANRPTGPCRTRS